jgi:DNA-binding CsgD family transcriptional regulator
VARRTDVAVGTRGRAWLERLDEEAANLASALEWAADHASEKALRLCAALTLWWRVRGLYAAAERGFGRSLDAADGAPSCERARAMWGRAHVSLFGGSYERALSFAHAARAVAEEVGDERALARSLAEIGAAQFQSDPMRARPILERACDVARGCGDPWGFVYAQNFVATSYVVADRYDEAERQADGLLALGERHGIRNVVALALWALSTAHLGRADLDRSAALAARSLAVAQEIGDPVLTGFAQFQLARLDLVQGQAGAALERLEASRVQLIAAGSGLPLAYTTVYLAAAKAAVGDHDAARTALESVIASGADHGRALAFAMLHLADVLRAAGNSGTSSMHGRQAREIGDHLGNPLIIAWSDELLAGLAIDAGEYGEAEARLHDALAARMKYGLRLGVPQTLDAFGAVAYARDSYENAARILGAARSARSAVGLVRWALDEPRLDHIESTLRDEVGEDAFAAGAALTLEEAVAWLRRGRGERKRPGRGWESLTPTEHKLVALVADGLTNPQIGQCMFISRGTVKAHLSHIFAKLEVSSRTELAAEAIRRGAVAKS